jgi:hypothetical protein
MTMAPGLPNVPQQAPLNTQDPRMARLAAMRRALQMQQQTQQGQSPTPAAPNLPTGPGM